MRLYHEQDVAHIKADGEFTFNAHSSDTTAAPSSGNPSRIAFKCRVGTATTISTLYASHGFGHAGAFSHSSSKASLVISASSSMIVFMNVYKDALSTPVTVRRTELLIRSVSGTSVPWRYQTIDRSVTLKTQGITNYSQIDAGRVMELWAVGTGERVNIWRDATSTGAKPATPVSFSPSAFRGWINTQAIPVLEEYPFDLEGVSYGELAMQASEKVNRNSTNMIAFLRDLRNPKALIPKLANLKKLKAFYRSSGFGQLKTLSGDYLAMKYGILPTISDLQEIASAFKKHQPYLDRHGWATYNANHIVSKGSDGVTITLEQRIKLAIQTEDNEFIQLMNRVDSSGFAPTLENLWDLIPYSFVLDWFIDIGGFLERVDTRMRLARLDIQYSTMSKKIIKTRNYNFLPGSAYTGTISLVQYTRWTQDQSPVPPLFFQNTPTVSNHWLEASALIIQRTK
jgi:hypothetical protein